METTGSINVDIQTECRGILNREKNAFYEMLVVLRSASEDAQRAQLNGPITSTQLE